MDILSQKKLPELAKWYDGVYQKQGRNPNREHIARNGWNMKTKTMAMKVANFKGHSRSKTEVLVFNYETQTTLFNT